MGVGGCPEEKLRRRKVLLMQELGNVRRKLELMLLLKVY
jgi:hypothetical protein